MTLSVRIVVRTNVPWEQMTLNDVYAQRGRLLDPFTVQEIRDRAHLAAWERATGRDFCQYRASIKAACQWRLEALEADALTIGLDRPVWLEDRSRDEILLPIDDDDSFEPGIIERMRTAFAAPGIDVVVWKRRINHTGTVTIAHANYLDTCNHALRKSFVQKWYLDDSLRMLANHWHCHDMTCERLNPPIPNNGTPMGIVLAMRQPARSLISPRVLALPEMWSTYYVHSASISFLTGSKMDAHQDRRAYLASLPLHPLVAR